jgi:1-deoxy-D-xylulose-5-phosphate reductoisomerase
MAKRIVILGSTGSIGENALCVVRHLADRFQVTGLVACRRVERLAEQAREFGCRWAHTAWDEGRESLAGALPADCRSLASGEELLAAVTAEDVDMVLCAIVGTSGLAPVLAAIRAGKDIALASKEILVMAGEIVMAEARRHGVRILPVDSEHCAIFQCLDGQLPPRRIMITASGGPFRGKPELDLSTVTPEMALAHPTWNMGAKISIDSATLMNKGLEVIEARWLFDLGPDQIEAVVHPQSIIHSMVEFADGSILAQMGYPDMQLPIQYCLTYPERVPSPVRRMDFRDLHTLTFEPPDHARFPALRLAHEALRAGGVCPCAFNAANEVAVERFVAGRLPFPGIWRVVEEVLAQTEPCQPRELAEILAADEAARTCAAEMADRIERKTR